MMKHLSELMHAGHHSLHIKRHPAHIIGKRVVLVSSVIAVLTPLWIIVDAIIFPWPMWGAFALSRIMSSAAFLGLTRIRNRRRSLHTAFLMLGVMLAIPPIFYLISQPLLAGIAHDDLARIAARSYSLLPFIVVAGLSMFPLTLLEVLIASAAVIATIAVGMLPHPNDGFGHEAGDETLRKTAIGLQACLRQSDILIRWGGEEFLVILPSTAAEGAARILQRLSAQGMGQRPDGSRITASIGVAERIADAREDWDQLVNLADQRMYRSKAAGKNCCTGYDTATSLDTLFQNI